MIATNLHNNTEVPGFESWSSPRHSIYPKEDLTAAQVKTILEGVLNTLPNAKVTDYKPEKWMWEWEYGNEPVRERMADEHGYAEVCIREEAMWHAVMVAQQKFPQNVNTDPIDFSAEELQPVPLPKLGGNWGRGHIEIVLTRNGPRGITYENYRPIIRLFCVRGYEYRILFNAIKAAVNGV